MPRGDGTGPIGTGPIGRGLGRGNRVGGGLGRMNGDLQAGEDGFCVCPKCGTKVKHQRAVPCNSIKCPQCGEIMTRA